MVAHKNLSGTDLHETKGVSGASINTVHYCSTPGTSGWKKVDTDLIDSTSVKNINKFSISLYHPDGGTAMNMKVPLLRNCRITAANAAVNNSVSGASLVITIANPDGTMGTLTFTTSAVDGTVVNVSSVASNNTFDAGETLRITSSVAGVTTSAEVWITVEFELV